MSTPKSTEKLEKQEKTSFLGERLDFVCGIWYE